MNIKNIIKKHAHGIFLVLLFVMLENSCWLMEPIFFGKLLDKLIEVFYQESAKNRIILKL
jgi:hypothetical protein